MKLKSLVIVNKNVTVKCNQTLHTLPITLEEKIKYKIIKKENFFFYNKVISGLFERS